MPTTTPAVWSDEIAVNTQNLDVQSGARIVATADGGFYVAWIDNWIGADGYSGDPTLTVQRFDAAGLKVGDAITIAVEGEQEGYDMIAMGNGFVISYANGDGTDGVRFYDESGALISESVIDLGGRETALTRLGDGSVILAYDHQDGVSAIRTIHFAPNGAVLGSDELFSYEVPIHDIQFSTGSSGRVILTYEMDIINGVRVSARGTYPILNWQDLGNDDWSIGLDYTHLRSSVWADGSSVIVYSQSNSAVLFAVLDANGEKLHTGALTAVYQQYASEPDVVACSDGGFMVVWTDTEFASEDEGSRIYLARFDALGNAVGSPVLVQTGLHGTVFEPTLTVLSDGRVVVSWQNDGDGSYSGISARIFDPREATLAGTTGSDTIWARQGDSVIDGFEGDDRLYGLQGDDTLRGGAGFDVLLGGNGDDTIDGGSGNDDIDGGMGDDRITGGSGDDWITGGQGLNYVDAGSGNDNVFTGGGTDEIWGGSGDETINAGNSNDFLYGGIGNDSLNGGGGADLMEGGADNDTYFVNHLGDQTVEAAFSGTDTVRAQGVNWTLADNLENLVIVSGNFNGTGNALGNVITGSSGNNVLAGLDGVDILKGMAGVDTLDGGAGNDNLNGGTGKDTMTGGAGADKFTYAALADSTAGLSNADVITDFSHAQGDRIDLAAIDAVTGELVNNAFAFIGTAAFSHTAGELRYRFDGAGNTVVSCDVNGDGAADMSIVLTGEVALVAEDFVL